MASEASVATSAVKFIRKGGKVIPIRAAAGAVKIGAGVHASRASIKNPSSYQVKPNQALKAAGFGLAVGGGILSGLSVGGSAKSFLLGHAAGIGIDVASSALNIAAHAGKGHRKERTEAILKQEGINQAAGWSVFGATALRSTKSRAAAANNIKSAAVGAKNFGLKAINFIRRVK